MSLLSTGSPIQIEVIKHVLWVQDMDRAIRFYRDSLGLVVQSESPHWTEFAFGDVIVALHSGGSGERTFTGLSFQVRDLDQACIFLAAHGGRVVKEPHKKPDEPVSIAHLLDPEGNEIMLTQWTHTNFQPHDA